MKILHEDFTEVWFEKTDCKNPIFTVYCKRIMDIVDGEKWSIRLRVPRCMDVVTNESVHTAEITLKEIFGSKADAIAEARRLMGYAESVEVKTKLEYTEFELWTYELYKLEWCVSRGVLPNDVDSEVGINGGECYVCLDEFLDNEFEGEKNRLRYKKTYCLVNLLAWISNKYVLNHKFIFENELHMTNAEIMTYFPVNVSKDILKDYSEVLCQHTEKITARLDELLKATLSFISNCADMYYVNFVKEFIIDMGLSMDIIQNYIEIPGVLTEEKYKARLEKIEKRCTTVGANFVHSFFDAEHLNCFWYSQDKIAFIKYAGCTARFYVQGEIDAHLYDENGYIKRAISHSVEKEGLYKDTELIELIPNDACLSALENTGKLEFFVLPWVNMEIRCDSTGEFISDKTSTWKSDNLLSAVEDSFDDIIETINKFNKY